MDSSNSPRKKYAREGGRELDGDKNTNPLRRRMDSMARLLHVRGTEVTAVGLNSSGKSQPRGLVLSVNHSKDRLSEIVHGRLQAISSFAQGHIPFKEAMRAFPANETDNPTLRNKPSQTRLGRDLKKVARSLQGDYPAESGRNFSPAMVDAVHGDRLHFAPTLEIKGHIDHAEITVARSAQGDIGVSRLNCLHCYDDIEKIAKNTGASVNSRGTSGYKFPNLANLPKKQALLRTESRDVHVESRDLYASDSDSGSDKEAHSPRAHSPARSPEVSRNAAPMIGPVIGPTMPPRLGVPDSHAPRMIGPTMPPNVGQRPMPSPADQPPPIQRQPVRLGVMGPNPDIANPPVFVPKHLRTTLPTVSSTTKKGRFGL